MRNLIIVSPGRCLTGVQRLLVKVFKSLSGPKSKDTGSPISKRIRNGSSTMDYLKIFLTENCALPIQALGDDVSMRLLFRLRTCNEDSYHRLSRTLLNGSPAAFG